MTPSESRLNKDLKERGRNYKEWGAEMAYSYISSPSHEVRDAALRALKGARKEYRASVRKVSTDLSRKVYLGAEVYDKLSSGLVAGSSTCVGDTSIAGPATS